MQEAVKAPGLRLGCLPYAQGENHLHVGAGFGHAGGHRRAHPRGDERGAPQLLPRHTRRSPAAAEHYPQGVPEAGHPGGHPAGRAGAQDPAWPVRGRADHREAGPAGDGDDARRPGPGHHHSHPGALAAEGRVSRGPHPAGRRAGAAEGAEGVGPGCDREGGDWRGAQGPQGAQPAGRGDLSAHDYREGRGGPGVRPGGGRGLRGAVLRSHGG